MNDIFQVNQYILLVISLLDHEEVFSRILNKKGLLPLLQILMAYKRPFNLIHFCVDREIAKEDETEIFRQNNITDDCLGFFISQYIQNKYYHDETVRILKKAIGNHSLSEYNLQFLNVVEIIITKIFKLIHNFPQPVKYIFDYIKTQALFHNKNGTVMLIKLLFLKIVNPMIINVMEAIGADKKITRIVRIIQMFANDMSDKRNDTLMSTFMQTTVTTSSSNTSPLVSSSSYDVHDIHNVHDVVDRSDQTTSSTTPTSSPKLIAVTSMIDLSPRSMEAMEINNIRQKKPVRRSSSIRQIKTTKPTDQTFIINKIAKIKIMIINQIFKLRRDNERPIIFDEIDIDYKLIIDLFVDIMSDERMSSLRTNLIYYLDMRDHCTMHDGCSMQNNNDAESTSSPEHKEKIDYGLIDYKIRRALLLMGINKDSLMIPPKYVKKIDDFDRNILKY